MLYLRYLSQEVQLFFSSAILASYILRVTKELNSRHCLAALPPDKSFQARFFTEL